MLALRRFAWIKPIENEEIALGCRDAARWNDLLAVLDDAPRYRELLKHESGK